MRSTFNGEKLALFGLIFRLLMGAARGDQIAGTTPRQFPGNGFRRWSNLKVLEDEIDKVDCVDHFSADSGQLIGCQLIADATMS